MPIASIRIRSSCPECGGFLGVDGPLELVTCRACHARTELPAAVLQTLMNDVARATPQAGNGTMIGQCSLALFYQLALEFPACARCNTPLPLERVAPGFDGDIHCVRCQAPSPTFPASAIPALAGTRIRQFFGALRDDTNVPSRDEGGLARAVSFSCPDCGGNLKIDAQASRLVDCRYCSATVCLPDALWHALHPVRRRARWFVAFV